MIVQSLMGVLAGSVLWLDRVYIFQFMVSRPLIMGPIIAGIMGDMKIGLVIGASLELLWLNAPPVGSYLPNDESFCTAVAVPVAFFAAPLMGQIPASGLSILLCLPVALMGKALDTRLRTLNEGLMIPGKEILEKDISKAVKKAIARAFLYAFIAISACVILFGTLIRVVAYLIPGTLLSVLNFMPFACVIIGLAALISKEMPNRIHTGLFLLGMTIVLFVTWIL